MDRVDAKDSRMTVIKTGHAIFSVLFTDDGKQVLGSGEEGTLRWWGAEDGRDVGEPIQVEKTAIYAAAVSPDGRWLVCGLKWMGRWNGKGSVRVLDAETHKEVHDIKEPSASVWSVSVSPDSTKFAASTSKRAFIFSITTGEKLVGPLEHDGAVATVRFSPKGDRIATANFGNGIRIFDAEHGQPLLDIPCRIKPCISSWLAWADDGHHIFAATAQAQVRRFDTSSGSLLTTWRIPARETGEHCSVILAHNQKFAVAVTRSSLSFWDVSSMRRLGATIEHTSTIWSTALSPNDDVLATGGQDGKIIIRCLVDILSAEFLTVSVKSKLPLIQIGDAVFKSWIQGHLARVEELLDIDIVHPINPCYHSRALAHRSLVRARSKKWIPAIEDATRSLEIQQSSVGRIAHAVAILGTSDTELAIRLIDQAIREAPSSDQGVLSSIKAVVLFNCGKHENAFSHLDRLIAEIPASNQSPYGVVRAEMQLLVGQMRLGAGEHRHALDLFHQAQKVIPVQYCPHLQVISLIFGWSFERLVIELQSAIYAVLERLGNELDVLAPEIMADWRPDIVQYCVARLENDGDVAAKAQDPERAIGQYSIALFLKPSKPSSLFIKRSDERAQMGLWKDVLGDLDEAIKADPFNPRSHEKKYAVLLALQHYDAALDAFTRMYSLIEGPRDQEISQLRKKYISPARLHRSINEAAVEFFKACPLVLIDLKTGRLCDELERSRIFQSEHQFQELFCSMTETLDSRRIKIVIEDYFRYATLSHVWKGQEPSYQDVHQAGSVWKLGSSLQSDKLHNFCREVAKDGYRWAWSDTCCIDKTINTVLNQSLKMMYRWYEVSMATYVHLPDVASSSDLVGLTGSVWMTRVWTSQELLAPKVIRFYTCDWKPYLGDPLQNHKDSPEIMQELADAVKISRDTLVNFNPDDLSNREKLRLASKRNATREEDVAYSLIGMFKSDIRPDYGERYAAVGHLLEEIVARSGDVTVLAWTGESSPYNSCLPSSLAVYSELPSTFSAIGDADLATLVAALRPQLPRVVTLPFHERVVALPPARFAHRRLHLPCIIFSVKRLVMEDFGQGQEFQYRARVPGIGHVDFQTSDKLSPKEPRRLIFVHPWIRDLCDPPDGYTWGDSTDEDDSSDSDSGSDSDSDSGFGVESAGMRTSPTSLLHVAPVPSKGIYTRSLHLIARLRQPFHALLLQQRPSGEFNRIACERDIIIPHLSEKINFEKDVGTRVVEIL